MKELLLLERGTGWVDGCRRSLGILEDSHCRGEEEQGLPHHRSPRKASQQQGIFF